MDQFVSLHWDTGGDVEDIQRYSSGGFHPIHLGDVLSSEKSHYRVLHRLGRGAFSTVWLAEALQEPLQRYVALKVCVADADPKHELEIFNHLSRTLPAPSNVLQLRDHFSLRGPNGVHTVLVSDVLGNLNILRSPNRPGHNQIRKLCREITVGLAALHHRGIVHGDLHIGNVGVSMPILNEYPPEEILDYLGNPQCTIVLPTTPLARPGTLPLYLVPPISVIDYLIVDNKDPFDGSHAEIMDFGSANIVDEHPRPVCTLPAVCAPELIFERFARPENPRSPPTRASDIWSLACTIYEVVSGTRLFHLAIRTTILEEMAMLCGEVPKEWKMYWESQDELRSLSISHTTAEAYWNCRLEIFTKGPNKGTYTEGDVKELFSLLRTMLMIDPTKRPSAEQVLKHPWFSQCCVDY